jgi:hypothetical protein
MAYGIVLCVYYYVCCIVRVETVICFDTHGFDVVTKQDVSQIAGALETLDVQLALWTHGQMSYTSAGGRNYTNQGLP